MSIKLKCVGRGFVSRYFTSLLFFVPVVLLAAGEARSEIDWLYQANSCEELSQGISRHFGSGDSMNSEKKAELRMVLFEGCGPRFRECNLSVCSKARSMEKSEARPLFWINQVKTCSEFKSEFRSRYSFLRKDTSLSPELALEIDYVLRRACSKDFGECGLSRCSKTATVTQQKSENPSDLAAQSTKDNPSDEQLQFGAQMQHYDSLVAENRFERIAAIEMQISDDKKTKVGWATAANPKEIEALKSRRKQLREGSRRNDNQRIPIRSQPPRYNRQGTGRGNTRIKPRRPVDTGNGSSSGPLVY